MLTVAEHRDRQTDASSPERTCVGCRAVDSRTELVRLAFIEEMEPSLVADVAGKLGGRGVWLHPRRACVRSAVRNGFSRALRQTVRADVDQVCEGLAFQLTRGIEGLVGAAIRRRLVALGTEAVTDVLRAGAVSLLLVAKDAAGRRDELVGRAQEGRVPTVELSDKAWLGRISAKETLGVLAILEPQIAREIATKARWLAGLSEDG